MAVDRIVRTAVGVTRRHELDAQDFPELLTADLTGTPTVWIDGDAIATIGDTDIDADEKLILVWITGVTVGRSILRAKFDTTAGPPAEPGGKTVLVVE